MMFKIQSATISARARTGDSAIGTRVGRNGVDVVRSVPPINGRGRHAVEVLRAGLTPAQAVAYLEAMQ